MRNTRISILGLGLVAVLVATAVGVASASASTMPELAKLPTKAGFTVASGKGEFETLAGHTVKCEKDSGSGKLLSTIEDESEIKFTGCTTTFIFTLKCQTGSTKGEIVLKVKSHLVWLDKTEAKEPGEDLELPSELKIECTGVATEKIAVTGSTLCPIKPFKTSSSTGEIVCKQSKGKQEFKHYFLGGSEFEDITKSTGSGTISFGPEESALSDTDTLTFEEPVEII